ncbi:hypothetical protein [Streptacidiphilus sp. MAP12-16]|uniref:hypothetical protein n=1 Tax=Streptacidiphilus sp. MAP12-16 TaxID=3156300 RepID=UPI0035170B63
MSVTVNLDKLLDKQYENLPIPEVVSAPVAAIQGLTDAHAPALAALKHQDRRRPRP